VHLAHEVSPQGDHEENAETAAGETDEDGLDRMWIEVKDVERRKREDRTGHNGGRCSAHSGDDHIFEQTGTPLVGAGEANREDGDRNRGLHALTHFQR
jgi:hypothetical protein